MNWYLQKNGGSSAYGPVTLTDLQRWAIDGRIAPNDNVSQDKSSWVVAANVADLDMNWFVEAEDGSEYGPIHVLSLREPVREGAILLHSTLRHKDSGDTQIVGEVLVEALLNRNAALSEQLESLRKERASAGPPKTETLKTAAQKEHEEHATWSETARRGDVFERDAQKWKKLYNEERASSRQAEDQLNERVRELRQNELTSRTQIEQVEQRIRQLETSYNRLKDMVAQFEAADPQDVPQLAAAQIGSLMEAYDKLSQSYDNLLRQVSEKAEELEVVLQSRTETEKDAEERVEKMREVLRREQDEADKARRRLAEMEQTHLELLKSYREMNDRFIRSRQPKTRV